MGSAKFNFVGQHHHQKTNLNEDRYLLPQNFIITPLVNMCNIICHIFPINKTSVKEMPRSQLLGDGLDKSCEINQRLL